MSSSFFSNLSMSVLDVRADIADEASESLVCNDGW